mmetsp:Transcript_27048/g.31012  ORF Transcript_27048/g.31012 Transcript_27048/m.31012 type:complete len:121 (+) Transcript_27048:31-393(+)
MCMLVVAHLLCCHGIRIDRMHTICILFLVVPFNLTNHESMVPNISYRLTPEEFEYCNVFLNVLQYSSYLATMKKSHTIWQFVLQFQMLFLLQQHLQPFRVDDLQRSKLSSRHKKHLSSYQ